MVILVMSTTLLLRNTHANKRLFISKQFYFIVIEMTFIFYSVKSRKYILNLKFVITAILFLALRPNKFCFVWPSLPSL